jgi:hypothetical protein
MFGYENGDERTAKLQPWPIYKSWVHSIPEKA